jgi:DNA-directed RNA polymerase subunit RPC12/RpoP
MNKATYQTLPSVEGTLSICTFCKARLTHAWVSPHLHTTGEMIIKCPYCTFQDRISKAITLIFTDDDDLGQGPVLIPVSKRQ